MRFLFSEGFPYSHTPNLEMLSHQKTDCFIPENSSENIFYSRVKSIKFSTFWVKSFPPLLLLTYLLLPIVTQTYLGHKVHISQIWSIWNCSNIGWPLHSASKHHQWKNLCLSLVLVHLPCRCIIYPREISTF